MKHGKKVTKVIFKKAYDHDTREWYVVAFFPGVTASRGRIMSYVHDGQHGEAAYEFYLACKSATPKEYSQLKRELEQCFGYRFKIVKKITRADCDYAWSGTL